MKKCHAPLRIREQYCNWNEACVLTTDSAGGVYRYSHFFLLKGVNLPLLNKCWAVIVETGHLTCASFGYSEYVFLASFTSDHLKVTKIGKCRRSFWQIVSGLECMFVILLLSLFGNVLRFIYAKSPLHSENLAKIYTGVKALYVQLP